MTTDRLANRIACSVPFCRRTTPSSYREWLCAKHWPLVSPALKARKRKAEGLLRRVRALDPDIRRDLELKFSHHAWTAWERCKAQAIERAMGIA